VDHLQISMGYLDAHPYDERDAAPQQHYQVQGPCAAADAYRQHVAQQLPGGFSAHPYSQLTAAEEQELWQGRPQAGVAHRMPAWLSRRGLFTPVDEEVGACPVPSGYVAECEQQLVSLVTQTPHTGSTPPYPLAPVGLGTDGAVLPLEKDMHNDLWMSWEVCHTQDQGVCVSPEACTAVPHILVSWTGRPVTQRRETIVERCIHPQLKQQCRMTGRMYFCSAWFVATSNPVAVLGWTLAPMYSLRMLTARK
jgi:hypothetical protein